MAEQDARVEQANQQILQVLMDQGEITWQSIINELVNSGEVDPWDVNISYLVERFIQMIQNLKEMNFHVSGKLVLASALLLKIKSNHLLREGIAGLDSLIASQEEPVDLFDDQEMHEDSQERQRRRGGGKRLVPRTPQPRKRKVSLMDLMKALEKALEVEVKRKRYIQAPEVRVPKREMDITQVIEHLYTQISGHFETKSEHMRFEELLPSQERIDRVLTFVPLLHLENQRKVDLLQKEHFGQINIALNQQKS